MTPLVRLRKVALGPQALCGKLEFMNPSSSLKDRILRHMVSKAEERGELRPGMTILEASTGSTGIATAIEQAGSGDIVLVAGKGHEQGQIIGSGETMRVHPFDDVTVARECAAAESAA